MSGLTILTPTAGRASLEQTLLSYVHQMGPDDEYLVIGDTTDGPLPETEAIVARFDARFRYIDGRSTFHSWGHLELGVGLDLARGAYVFGCDDDDVGTLNALADIRSAIARLTEPRPLLFQFMTPWRQVLWDYEGHLEEAWIGGHSAVFPNLPGRLGRYSARYNGDWDYIVDTLGRWPNGAADAVWCPGVIAWTRPTAEELARLIPEGVLV